MGVFDVMCEASGIVLDGRARLLFLLQDDDGATTPLLPPLRGTYDRYGKIENPVPGPELSAAESLAKLVEMDDVESVMQEAFDTGIPFAKGTLRYGLIDEVVYRAVVATVASGGMQGVSSEMEAQLEAMPFSSLVAAAVGAPEIAGPLLLPFKNDDGLRHELVSLALFRKMELPIGTTSVDSGGEQYGGFHANKTDSPVEPETRAAEKRFAAYPLILAAIAENARAWIARGEDDADDDDDEGDNHYVVEIEPVKGHAIPPLLQAFGSWLVEQEHGTVGYFDILRTEEIPKQWATDKEVSKRLRASAFAFLTLPDGSLLALLTPSARSPEVVVLVGSEGEARTVASSLEDFLLRLSRAETGVDELDDEEAGAGRKKLAAWLKKHEVKARRDVGSSAFDFKAWLTPKRH